MLGALSLVGACILMIATQKHGVGVSPDSVGYVSVARHIAAGEGARTFLGDPLTVQPPLYPAFLAVAQRGFGVDPLEGARWLNVACFAFILFLSGRLVWQLTGQLLTSLVATILLLVSLPLYEVSVMAWSEPLFLVFTLAYLLAAQRYWERGGLGVLFGMALSTAAACMTRYAGLALVGSGALTLGLVSRAPRERVRDGAVFLASSLLPLMLWAIRNHRVSGTWLGPSAPPMVSVADQLRYALETISTWVFPIQVVQRHSCLASIVIIATILVILACAVHDWRGARRWAPLVPTGLFVVSYVFLLFMSAALTFMDGISNRLLVPIYPAIVAGLFSLFGGSRRSKAPRWRVALVGIAVLAWLFVPARETRSFLFSMALRGRGYTSEEWRSSPTIRAAEEMIRSDGECDWFSNAPDALYILAGQVVQRSPVKDANKCPIFSPHQDREFAIRQSCGYLIWFDAISRQYVFTPEELARGVHLRTLYKFPDGAIYEILQEPGGAASL